MSSETDKRLIFVILLAFILRFIGLNHGFPYIFHPDEPTIIRSALGIRFDPNPAHFDWPHLYIYLNYFVYMIFAKVRDLITLYGYKENIFYIFPMMWDDHIIFYFLTRIFSATLGALTVIPIYKTAKNLFNKDVALAAGLALAVTPFHVWHSHYSLADIPMTFALSWVLFFSSKILFSNDLKNYLMAGIFIGIATSLKYNGAIGALFVVVAHFMRYLSERDEPLFYPKSIQNLFISGLSSILIFVLGTPYSVLDYQTFLRTDGPKGALWQFTNVGNVSFPKQVSNFFYAFSSRLMDDFGYTIIILFIICTFFVVIHSLKEKQFFIDRDLLFFVITGLFMVFYVAGFEKNRSHYFLIAYPALILGGIGLLDKILINISSMLKTIIFILLFSIPLYVSVLNAYAFYLPDTRQELDHWLLDNRSNRYVYYNSTDLSQIFENKKDYSTKVDVTAKNLTNNALFVIPNADNITRSDLELLIKFDNNLKRGPNISVYKIK